MAGEVFSWANGGYDVHALATTPVVLSQLLRVILPGDATPHLWAEFVPPNSPRAGVTVVFTTLTKTFTTAVQGIAVDPLSGRVDSVANPQVRNVIVTATVTGTDATNPSKSHRFSIRVFLHDSVTRVQVTPATLHIPAGRSQTFSVLAVFSDGAEGSVVGDITRFPLSTWDIVGGNSTDVTVATNGLVQVSATPQSLNQPANLRVTLDSSLGSPPLTATADAFPVQGWNRDVEVKPVGEASLDNYQNARNILFLPDGFTDGDGEQKFNQAVEILAGHLRNSRSSDPFGLFINAKSLNLYKAWIPSPEEGSGILNDLSVTSRNNTRRVPIPRDPTTKSDPGIGDLNDLIWAVGLPTKTRAAQTSFSSQVSEWTTLFGFPPPTVNVQSLWRDWKKLYPRVVAVERDTAFGSIFGHRPQVSTLTRERDTVFNPLRTVRNDIEPLLTRLFLKSEAGLPVAQRIGRQFKNDFNTPPQNDQARVYILLNSPINAGASSSVIMSALITEEAAIDGAVPPDGEIITPVIRPIVNNTLPADVRGTAAHELGHTFNLDDEYSEFIGNLPANTDLTGFWNVQESGSVGNPIIAAQIRWGIGTATAPGWKRLRAAAVLRDLPTVSTPAPNFRVQIPIRPEQFTAVSGLAPGTLLRLRRRPLVGTYAQGRFESNQITLDVVDLDHQIIEGVVDAAGAQAVQDFIEDLIIQLVPPSTVIVTVPRLDATGQEQGLMHSRIGQLMHDTNSALNRKQGIPCANQTENFVQSPVNFLPDTFLPRRFITRIVGLYDGGHAYSCGIYHPQGLCQMRSHYARSPQDASGQTTFEEPEGIFVAPTRKPELTEFCPVCKYILVDNIDPSSHGPIDDEYDLQYPDLVTK